MSTVAAALAAARARLPANEARLLLGHVLGRSSAWLIVHDDDILAEAELLAFASLVARRAGGEPLAYLVGKREFFGRDYAVASGVLIPRPETELLVEIAIANVASGAAPRILDLGTGSGCLAITLALEMPQAHVTAVDISAAALQIAGRNAERLGATLHLLQSDWFSALPGERFDLIVANPPYIADGDPHLAAGDLRHEPKQALTSGSDGLEAIRRILATAPGHLMPGGQLWIEHGYDQAAAVQDLFAVAGLVEVRQLRDLAGILRATGGRLPDATMKI